MGLHTQRGSQRIRNFVADEQPEAVALQIEGPVIRVLGDKECFEQVLLILFANAHSLVYDTDLDVNSVPGLSKLDLEFDFDFLVYF